MYYNRHIIYRLMNQLLAKFIALALLCISHTLISQSENIMYVYPDHQVGAEYDKIRESILIELRNCLEGWTKEISATTYKRTPVSYRTNLFRNPNIDYILFLKNLPKINTLDDEILLSFEFSIVDDNFEVKEIDWHNSTYVLKLDDNKEPINEELIVEDVCNEVAFYLKTDDPNQRKFRPRIKIDEFERPSVDIEEIDSEQFRKYLKTILEDEFDENPMYTFYYSRKYDKHFPENSIYIINGEFKKYRNKDDKLVKVSITIDLKRATDVDDVIIHVENFEDDPETKDRLIEEIVETLEEKIKFYEKR